MPVQTRKPRQCTTGIQKSKKVVISLSQREKDFLDELDNKKVESIFEIFRNTNNKRDDVPIRMSVLTSSLPEEIKLRFFNTLEADCSDKYVSLVKSSLTIPFGKIKPFPKTSTKKFLENAKNIMDDYISGNEASKNEVLKLICQWKNGSFENGYAIGLEGEPGTGKTTFAKHAFSKATNLPLVFIGLGGVEDPSYLLGTSYSYEGSTYGRLVSGLMQSQFSNTIFYFDELDKIPNTNRGEQIVNILIHLIDPAQNSHIRDKYFPFDIDFSKCTFVFSYNDPDKICPVLLDRIKRIHLDTPTKEEKIEIMKKYIVPKTLERLNTFFKFENESLELIACNAEKEVGMRAIEKCVEHVVSSANLSKSFGSLSILGINKPYKLKDTIQPEFVSDLLYNKKRQKPQNFVGMMYT